MSDRTQRDERTVDAGAMGDLGVAWLAEREARAILAETEPVRITTDGCAAYHLPLRYLALDGRSWHEGGRLNEVTAALAEALAAFVAD